jgi:hypothetical protein
VPNIGQISDNIMGVRSKGVEKRSMMIKRPLREVTSGIFKNNTFLQARFVRQKNKQTTKTTGILWNVSIISFVLSEISRHNLYFRSLEKLRRNQKAFNVRGFYLLKKTGVRELTSQTLYKFWLLFPIGTLFIFLCIPTGDWYYSINGRANQKKRPGQSKLAQTGKRLTVDLGNGQVTNLRL